METPAQTETQTEAQAETRAEIEGEGEAASVAEEQAEQTEQPEKQAYGIMDKMTLGVDELAQAIAFVQHWTGRSSAKAGNPVPDELMDTVAQACAFNMGIEPVGFTQTVAMARADLAQASRAAQEQAAEAQRAQQIREAQQALRDQEAFGQYGAASQEEDAKRPYNPADYDEDDFSFGSSGGGSMAFDFMEGGHVDACTEDDCATCRFANENCFANENL